MAATCLSSSFLFCLFLATVKSQLLVVNVTTIKGGEPFSVTCDADRVSVPANINYITSVTILRNTSILQTIAEYRFNGSSISLKSENIPSRRNWTISFTGAGTNENNRAKKITVVVYDSTCADAGLYICHVEYTDDNGLDMTSEKVENVTADADYKNPYFRWITDHHPFVKGPCDGIYMLNNRGRLRCEVDGPSNGVKLVWRVGRRSNMGDRTFTDSNSNGTDELAPKPVYGDTCNQYRYVSFMILTINEFDEDVMYQCVARDRSGDSEVGNTTIIIGKAVFTNPVFSWDPNSSNTTNSNHAEYMLNETVTLTCTIDGPSDSVMLIWSEERLQPDSCEGDHNSYGSSIGNSITMPISGNLTRYQSTKRMTINEIDHDDVTYWCHAYGRCEEAGVGKVTITLNKVGYSNPVFSWVPNHSCTGNPNQDKFMVNETVTLTCRINGPRNGVKLVWRVGRLQPFSSMGDRTFSDYSIVNKIIEESSEPVSPLNCNRYHYLSMLRMTINEFDHDVMYQCVARNISDTEVGNVTITLNKAVFNNPVFSWDPNSSNTTNSNHAEYMLNETVALTCTIDSMLRMFITLSGHDDVMYQCVVRSSIPGDTEVGNVTITLNKGEKITARDDASFLKAWISQLFLGLLACALLMYK